eukprot:Clim_evm13s227 gene=Clim_evmTU13s227
MGDRVDDDLDDLLNEALDDFDAKKKPSPKKNAASSTATKAGDSSAPTGPGLMDANALRDALESDDASFDQFASQLEAMMQGQGGAPGGAGQQADMAQAFMQEMMAAMVGGGPGAAAGAPPPTGPAGAASAMPGMSPFAQLGAQAASGQRTVDDDMKLISEMMNNPNFMQELLKAEGVPAEAIPKAEDLKITKEEEAELAEIMGKMGLGHVVNAPGTPAKAESSSASKPKATPKAPAGDRGAAPATDPLASSINAAMERLQTNTREGTEDTEMDGLEELLKSMGGEGDASMLPGMQAMMEQLLGKEMIYEPVKDLVDAYPGWLDANEDTLTEEEHKKYTAQYGVMKELKEAYENETGNFNRILELMSKVQEHGHPPQSLLSQVVPGMEYDANGQPKLPDNVASQLGAQGCPMQ